MHRLCGCPMYYILNICSVTTSALYFGPCHELSCWLLVLYVLISSAFCPLPHRTAPLPLKGCAQGELTQGPCPWLGFPSAPPCSALSVSHCLPVPLRWSFSPETPSPRQTQASPRPCPQPLFGFVGEQCWSAAAGPVGQSGTLRSSTCMGTLMSVCC